MTLQFSGVVLDLDGLLLDTEKLQFEVGPTVLSAMGYDLAPAFFHSLVGVDRIESARLINLEVGATINGGDLDRAWNAAMDEKMRDSIPLRPGVHDFLDALDERKLPRAIATNSVTTRAQWKLEHAGLLDRINVVVGVDMVNRGKPAPDVYIAAAEKLGLLPPTASRLTTAILEYGRPLRPECQWSSKCRTWWRAGICERTTKRVRWQKRAPFSVCENRMGMTAVGA